MRQKVNHLRSDALFSPFVSILAYELLTDFYRSLYEGYAVGGHPIVVFLNFLLLLIKRRRAKFCALKKSLGLSLKMALQEEPKHIAVKNDLIIF